MIRRIHLPLISFLFNKQFLKKILLIIFLLAFCSLLIPKSYPQPTEKLPLILYANQCDDEIRTCFIKAIQQAKKSIYLYIYSLNDLEIIKELQKKRANGVVLKIVIDADNKKGLQSLNECIIPKDKKTGLMHQKILVIDEEITWIGSANFTTSSLRAHDNLIVAIFSPQLSKSIIEEHGGIFFIGSQKIEVFLLPQEKKQAFERVVTLLESAQKSMEIAMFTWTHPKLTEKVIESAKKGIRVRAVLDETSSIGVSKKCLKKMHQEQVDIKINTGSPLLHHKFAYIDQTLLLLGSTNWTKAAFSKNDECIVIIHDLTKNQRKKMDQLCHALRSTTRSP